MVRAFAMMIEKGYNSIEDFRGKLKPYQKGKKVKRKRGVSKTGNSGSSNDTFKNALIFVLFAVCMFLLAERYGILKLIE